MPIRLRPHHLLCMLTFAGRGYSDDFVVNFKTIVERLRRGEDVRMVSGTDDVCAPLRAQQDDAHCEGDSVLRRDRIALLALGNIPELAELLSAEGSRVDAATLAALRAHFTSGLIRGACSGCEWSPLCTQIAADNYASATL